MTKIISILIFTLFFLYSTPLLPPKFQWNVIDFDWGKPTKEEAVSSGSYIAENNMPTGLARWKDKLFITIPRWKNGVPSCLNYVNVNDTDQAVLKPYPSWDDAYVPDKACCIPTNMTVVSTFRIHVDKCNRLWVADNGVTDMSGDLKQITAPAILVFDLNTDKLIKRYVINEDTLRDSTVMTSIVVETVGNNCNDAYAYITDMGSNAVIVYSLKDDDDWRVENHYFHFDPHAGEYDVGGIHFYWSDGVSSAALSNPNKDGYCDLYLQPTSSTRQFKISTKLLRNKDLSKDDIFNGVEIVGNRGPNSQITACDYDLGSNVLFYTQVCKNGLACWNVNKPYNDKNAVVILSDCNILQFPNDVKVDDEGNVWLLSDKQSQFLYNKLDTNQVNFRILTAPVKSLVKGTSCEACPSKLTSSYPLLCRIASAEKLKENKLY